MLFGGNKRGNKSPFPGYELKVGELCSLPALTTNDSSARILNIPAGCIPVCIRMDATFKASSGKGETPDLVLDVRDNNGNILFRACRNGAGQIYNNGTAYLCPLGAYNGDLERAKTCTQIHVRAHNDSAWLYSDYQYGKVAVTMWLEKNSGGGGVNSHFKLFKNPFVKPFYTLCKSVKRYWKRGVEHVVRWL